MLEPFLPQFLGHIFHFHTANQVVCALNKQTKPIVTLWMCNAAWLSSLSRIHQAFLWLLASFGVWSYFHQLTHSLTEINANDDGPDAKILLVSSNKYSITRDQIKKSWRYLQNVKSVRGFAKETQCTCPYLVKNGCYTEMMQPVLPQA